jgi:RNase P/RNase MRP subunit p29
MTIIGEEVAILQAKDPTVTGRKGTAVLETANTVVLLSEKGKFTVEKKGTVFLLSPSGRVAAGEDIAGRLEDRLRSKKR